MAASPLTSPPSTARGASLRVLLSTVCSDAHTWNLVYLDMLLRNLGHVVHNLGPSVPDRLLLRECLRSRPDLVVISTVNGHGLADGLRQIRALRRRRRLAAVPVVIGGKLSTTAQDGGEPAARKLLAAGYDAVFADEGDLARFRALVDGLAARAA